MFASLKMKLESDEKLTYNKASTLQGVMFEHIDTIYSEKLHAQGLHPYSQYLYRENEEFYWVVNSLDSESYEMIIKELQKESFDSFTIKKGDIDVKIVEKNIRILEKKDLLNELNSDSVDRYINLTFLTPVTFKQKGTYVCLPDIRLIYQSMMK